MGATRRFRRPVLSRLTLAWGLFGAGGAGLVAYAFLAAQPPAPRVALAIESKIERTAPAPGPSIVAPHANDRLEPGAVAAADDGAPFEDAFGRPDAPYTEGTLSIVPEEVIITVDGAPARDRAHAHAAQKASHARAQVAIAAPDPALMQKTALGAIPKIAADGRSAARAYARRDLDQGAKSRVGVVVGGLGLNADLTARAIDELPPEVTLAFAPYAKNLEYWTERARAAGHEIMVELPMEAQGGAPSALGPAALATGRAAADNLKRLDWLLSRFPGYFGATNYLGSKLSADREAMAPILARLQSLGVAYLDDTGALRDATKANVGVVDRMLVAEPEGGMESALKGLEEIAAGTGAALGKAYVSDASLDALRDWTLELSARGLALAPASAILQAQAERG